MERRPAAGGSRRQAARRKPGRAQRRPRASSPRTHLKTYSDKAGSGSSQEGPRSAERKPRRRGHALHAEQAPSAAVGAADTAFQAAEHGPEALVGPAAVLAGFRALP